MERIKYSFAGGLSEAQIGTILDDAVGLLGTVGVTIEEEEVLGELARRRGVRVDGSLVFYDADVVETFIDQVRKQNDEYMLNIPGRAEALVRPPFMCIRVWDAGADAPRMATVDDLARAVKLLDSYGAEGVPPVHPQDVPAKLRQIVTAKTSYENSRGIGSYMMAGSIEEVELLCRMGEAAGRPGPHVAMQIPHSPMKLDAFTLKIILDMKRAKHTPKGVTVGGGAMPLAGAAAPLLMPGFLAQGLAEALAAYGTAKLLNEDVGGYCSVFPGTFDMRYGVLSMASPEQLVYWLAARQIHEHVFGQKVGGDFACTGKTYDVQTGAEKTAAILMSVMSGATTFVNAGMTPSDEVFHFAGAVIDMEILDYAWRAGRGLAWEDAPTEKIVREGRAEGTFMTHPTTGRFREELYDPKVFTREGLNQWLAEGKPTVAGRAAAVAEERISGHSYRMDKEVQKELNRILAMAEKELT